MRITRIEAHNFLSFNHLVVADPDPTLNVTSVQTEQARPT